MIKEQQSQGPYRLFDFFSNDLFNANDYARFFIVSVAVIIFSLGF